MTTSGGYELAPIGVLEVLETGPLTTVQDLGRPGHAALGVPRSGAFDRSALGLANRLVGNAERAAALEVTLGGLVIRVHRACTVALTGAVCEGLDPGVAATLRAGTTVRLSPPRHGLRSYLAIRGGVDAEMVLGSRSTDTLSGLGPRMLAPHDVLHVGTPDGPVSAAWAGLDLRSHPIPVTAGPRTDWFDGDVLANLTAVDWIVRHDSDRVGVRLDGPPLTRACEDELPSEATLPGAVQVPPDGRPIVFGPDAPVTGGYPVIAVVDNLSRLAQLRPGEPLRFVLSRGTGAGSPT